jgi:hypothetical protein
MPSDEPTALPLLRLPGKARREPLCGSSGGLPGLARSLAKAQGCLSARHPCRRGTHWSGEERRPWRGRASVTQVPTNWTSAIDSYCRAMASIPATDLRALISYRLHAASAIRIGALCLTAMRLVSFRSLTINRGGLSAVAVPCESVGWIRSEALLHLVLSLTTNATSSSFSPHLTSMGAVRLIGQQASVVSQRIVDPAGNLFRSRYSRSRRRRG